MKAAQTNKEPAAPYTRGYDFEKRGIMSHQDYIKVMTISANAGDKGISLRDLNFMIHALNSRPLKPTRFNTYMLQITILSAISWIRAWSIPQRDRCFQAIVPFLSSKEPTERAAAVSIVYHLKDSSAIPYLKKLTRDTDSTVRSRAQDALQSLAPGAR